MGSPKPHFILQRPKRPSPSLVGIANLLGSSNMNIMPANYESEDSCTNFRGQHLQEQGFLLVLFETTAISKANGTFSLSRLTSAAEHL